MERWIIDDVPDQAGRTFVITGANSGLGFETARAVARRGAHVVMTARSRLKGETAVERLRSLVPRASAEYRLLDLADLDSVHAFAEALTAGPPGDVLVNNAGVMWPPRTLTRQGFELQFATNHLGHFALTALLYDWLGISAQQGRDVRVVTVTSVLHRGGRLQRGDLTGDRSYSPTAFYAQSKFANVVFGLELDRRLRAIGSPIRSVLAHPGYAATNLQTSGPTGLRKRVYQVLNVVLAQPADRGAWSQLYAATDPDVEGGQLIGPDGPGEMRGRPTVVQPVHRARDPETAQELWSLSEKLTGVPFPLDRPK
ncbi:oxidoreductase [Actinomadura oligospora]|uniref:oxidoreductase n=1 Tax=Actinomadura oligospora TaxID=111804 RepID=UPI000479A7DB|nr:oxidoreductase [Actinomadura oligospora]